MAETEADTVKALSEKLEIINLQFARRKAFRREVLHWSLIAFCALLLAGFAALAVVNSPYLGWDFSDPETAVMGTALHAFEWGFARLAPFAPGGGAVRDFPDAEKGVIDPGKYLSSDTAPVLFP